MRQQSETHIDDLGNIIFVVRSGSSVEASSRTCGIIECGRNISDALRGAGGIRAATCVIRLSIIGVQPLKGKKDQPSSLKMGLRVPAKLPTTATTSAVERRATLGVTAAKATAPQVRTEKAVEKRILSEIKDERFRRL